MLDDTRLSQIVDVGVRDWPDAPHKPRPATVLGWALICGWVVGFLMGMGAVVALMRYLG